MPKSYTPRHIFVALLVCAAVIWVVFVLLVGPEELVHIFGVEGGYVLLAFFGVIAGFSTLTAISFYVTIGSFILADFNPLGVAVIAGLARSVGDSAFYYIVRLGRILTIGRLRERVERLSLWLSRRSNRTVALVIWIFYGFSIFPTEIVMTTLALGRYPYRKIILPLILGNITFVLILTLIVLYGSKFFAT